MGAMPKGPGSTFQVLSRCASSGLSTTIPIAERGPATDPPGGLLAAGAGFGYRG